VFLKNAIPSNKHKSVNRGRKAQKILYELEELGNDIDDLKDFIEINGIAY
jgi:archaellum component FlaC